jgi:ankyrin repeat protein
MPAVREFQDSVKKGDLEAVRSALEADSSLLDATNEAGQSAFLLAKYYRQEAMAAFLLSLNPKLDLFTHCAAGHTAEVLAALEKDPALMTAHSGDGWTPLHLAAFFGCKDLAEALLARGAEIESRSTNSMKNTPLHAATAGRRNEMVKLLLERGADANAMQEGGWTALHGASQNGDRDMVETLIAHGADINARAGNNQCAMDMALLRGHQQIADLLEGLGAKL